MDRLKSIYAEYRALTPVGLLLVAIILVYYSSAQLVFNEWQSGAYSHGVLAIPIMLYLLSLDSDKLVLSRSIHWLPMLTLVGGTIAWVGAKAANVFFIEILSLFAIFTSAVGMLYGPRIWLQCFAALLSILLVMPVFGFLQLPLQAISADVTQVVLRLIGVAVYREDFTFIVPGGAFIIEPACSGLGFFLSSCLLSVIYAKVFDLNARKTIVLFCAAVAISIISNWLRIIIIMVVGNETQMQHPIVSDHVTFGWILFSVMLVPFIMIANRLISSNAERSALGQDSADTAVWEPRMTMTTIVPVAALLIAGPAILYTLDNRESNTVTNAMVQTLEETLPITTSRSPVDWAPVFVGATEVDVRRATYEQRNLLVLKVYYRSQDQNKEIINYANSLFDANRWSETSQFADDAFNTLLLKDRRGRERLVLYAYYVNGQFTSNERVAKILELAGFFLGNREAYLIGIAIDNPTSEDRELLKHIGTILNKKV